MGEGMYDHCLVLDEDDTVRAFRPNPELLELLDEHDFPTRFDEHLDQETIDFYVAMQLNSLEHGLRQFPQPDA